MVLVIGCGSEDLPPLSDATSLACPGSGELLPFRLDSYGFARSENETFVVDHPREKDESSDTIGKPDGLNGSIYLPDSSPTTNAPWSFAGVKARTTETGGLFSTPLPGEHVSLWFYDGTTWQTIGRATTDEDGFYDIAPTLQPPEDATVYSVLEADTSCAEHHALFLPPGSKVIVSDIDGTLTLSDAELLMQVPDNSYVPKQMGSGAALTQAWAAKHYPVIYLTARVHPLRNETRGWLRDLEFAEGPVITTDGIDSADIYKTAWMNRMIQDFGWDVVAVYGNADTDITAYENAGIPKNLTFIVGDLAGARGTTAIPNLDFSDHISTFVAAQPDN